MRFKLMILACLVPAATAFAQQGRDSSEPIVPKPAALVADGIPAVPVAVAAQSRPYMEYRTASFASWNARNFFALNSASRSVRGSVASSRVVAAHSAFKSASAA